MSTSNNIINKLEFLLNFLKENENFINLNLLNEDFNKFERKIKSSIIITPELKELFSNKTIFPNLVSIKEFMKKIFKKEISERSTNGILANIMY